MNSICKSTVHIAKFALVRQKNLLKHNTHNIWIQARLIISIIISNTDDDDGFGTIVIMNPNNARFLSLFFNEIRRMLG